ncbi:MAG TPA: hypothetical protein VJB38_06145 [Bacteroidota bacterium]|nr:hypothetical protein [Bacteroidota bacterium]
MSLKAFHIFFIVVSILFAAGFGIWFLIEQPISSQSLNVLAAVLSFTVGGGLILYAIRFVRKIRSMPSEEDKQS